MVHSPHRHRVEFTLDADEYAALQVRAARGEATASQEARRILVYALNMTPDPPRRGRPRKIRQDQVPSNDSSGNK